MRLVEAFAIPDLSHSEFSLQYHELTKLQDFGGIDFSKLGGAGMGGEEGEEEEGDDDDDDDMPALEGEDDDEDEAEPAAAAKKTSKIEEVN